MEDVEPAGRFKNARQYGRDLLSIEKVDDERQSAFADLPAKSFELILGAVDEHDRCPLGMEGTGIGQSDARCGARNGSHLTFHETDQNEYSLQMSGRVSLAGG